MPAETTVNVPVQYDRDEAGLLVKVEVIPVQKPRQTDDRGATQTTQPAPKQ